MREGEAFTQAADVAAPASAPEDPASAQKRTTPRQWIKVAAGKVPATWITVAATAVFLGATAGFGGLADAPGPEPEPLPVLAAGETHTNQQFDITVERAVLIDELPGSGTYPKEGERVLAVVATLQNITDDPLLSSQFSEATFTIEELPAERPSGDEATSSIARVDDSTLAPWLQPDVPVQVVVTWPVPADLLGAGDLVRLTLSDYERYDWARLGGSEDDHSWVDPAPAAYVDLEIEDVGAGADSEEDGG